MAKYEVKFQCKVYIEAENAEQAIKDAWLTSNLNNARYKYLDVKKITEWPWKE